MGTRRYVRLNRQADSLVGYVIGDDVHDLLRRSSHVPLYPSPDATVPTRRPRSSEIISVDILADPAATGGAVMSEEKELPPGFEVRPRFEGGMMRELIVHGIGIGSFGGEELARQAAWRIHNATELDVLKKLVDEAELRFAEEMNGPSEMPPTNAPADYGWAMMRQRLAELEKEAK